MIFFFLKFVFIHPASSIHYLVQIMLVRTCQNYNYFVYLCFLRVLSNRVPVKMVEGEAIRNLHEWSVAALAMIRHLICV